MRKTSIFALVFCLVLGLSVAALAKETSHAAKGPITTVNAADNSFAIKGKSGDETFAVTASTKIEEHGKTITLNDLKSGEQVEVWYTSNAGKNEASKVVLLKTMEKAKSSKTGR